MANNENPQTGAEADAVHDFPHIYIHDDGDVEFGDVKVGHNYPAADMLAWLGATATVIRHRTGEQNR